MTDADKKKLLVVGGIVALVLMLAWNKQRNGAAISASDQTTEIQSPDVPVVDGMPYFNLGFQVSGNSFPQQPNIIFNPVFNGNLNNPLSAEYMPLFGFIATRFYV